MTSILDAYLFTNKGDVAIVEGTLAAFRNSREFDIEVNTVLGFNHKLWMKKLSKYYDITFSPNLSEPFLQRYLLSRTQLQCLRHPLSCFKKIGYYMNEYVNRTVRALSELENTDLLWVLGGMPYGGENFSGAIFGISRLLSSVGITKVLKKKCIIGGQSFGGDYSPLVTGIVGRNMLKCDYVIVREPLSYNLLTEIKILNKSNTRIALGYDYAFNCKPKRTRDIDLLIEEARAMIDESRMEQAVTMNVSVHARNYVDELIELGNRVLSEGYVLMIYPHDMDDMAFILYLFQKLKAKVDSVKRIAVVNTMPYTAGELYYFLSSLANKGAIAWNVSFRSHSAIAHLSNLIPTLHIAYSHKGTGIMRMLKLEQYVLPLNSLDWTKIRELAFLVSNKSDEYKSYLEDLIPYIRHKIVEQTDAGIKYLMRY